MKKLLYIILLIGFASAISAQEGEEGFKEDDKKNRISFLMGTAYINRGSENGDNGKGIFVPIIGLDYSRALTEKFALGLFTDLELSSYFVELGSKVELKRENAAVIVLAGIYEVVERWVVEAGYGIELEKNKSFGIFRFGTSYEVPIRKNWDVNLALSYDINEDYGTWSFAIGFGKSF